MQKESSLEQDNAAVLPEGNVFGTVEDDEFSVNLNEEEKGVFKRFEYPSMAFSITGNEDFLDELFARTETEGASFKQLLEEDKEAEEVVHQIYDRMEQNPGFSRELLDNLLSDIYVDDNAIAQMETGDTIEERLGKFVAGWKQLSDFYGIEGLVGGDAEEINPFLEEDSSMVAGGLDSLERKLPSIRDQLSEDEWNENLIKISSLVDRDYQQIDRGVDILEHIHGLEELEDDIITDSQILLDELVGADFETNGELGKFYNTYIRFHNWMPLQIKADGPEGDAYDSICAPASEALEMVDGPVYESLSEIGDATSPKGLALAWLVDDEVEVNGEKLGDREELVRETKKFEDRIDSELEERRESFETFTYDDPAMYPGLVGGKWKGLKLLNDAKEVFDLDYEMPEAEVLTDIGVERLFDQAGIGELIQDNLFSMEENTRKEIVEKIDSLDVSNFTGGLDGSIIARSSMYGEDGASNFAGTYDSFSAQSEYEEAVRNVLSSYFSEKAVKAREDKGLTHNGGRGVILQEKVEAERGGVIHLTEDGYSITEGEDPENAVEGNGYLNESDSFEELLEDTAVEDVKDDIEKLHSVFGDIDVEYVSDGEDVYLTQMRPKNQISRDDREIEATETYTINSFEELSDTDLNGGENYIVRMEFLGRDNIMDKEEQIEDFLRDNRENVEAVEGKMPPPAHIPNNIEGHFRIPYQQISE